MENLKYTDCAVAFIDVLGFKNIVRNSVISKKDFDKLKNLVMRLDEAVPKLNNEMQKSFPDNSKPKHKYISDSIILSAHIEPLENDYRNYCGLALVVMRCIQLTQFLLKEGYLVRGGIEIGEVWHNDTNIIGPAYIDAYKLESEEAKNPCILMGEKARDMWKKKHTDQNNRMCIEYENNFIVNGLYSVYFKSLNETLEEDFNNFSEIIGNIIKELGDIEKIKDTEINSYIESIENLINSIKNQ